MSKKDSSAEDQRISSHVFKIQGDPNFSSEFRNNRNQYDRVNKLVDELKVSTQYIPRTCYKPNPKNYFKDLNQKFQELETKIFEVEKCFKEANKRDMDKAHRLMGQNDMKYPTESVQNIQQSRFNEITECRKETSVYPSEGIKAWFGDHRPHSTVQEKKQHQNDGVVRDGSGDAPHLQSEELSEDSCKTFIRLNEKPPFRYGVKGIFTLNHFEGVEQCQSPKNYIPEDNNNSTDVYFLEKSKKLILTLIDKELKKIETKPNHLLPTDTTPDATRNLKVECIKNIERELMTLKKLGSQELQQ